MRRRKGLGDVKACGRLDIAVDQRGDYVKFVAHGALEPEGGFGALESTREGKHLKVEFIAVQTKRCGVGTKLYEAAAQWACAHKLTLISDTYRSADSDGFWQKQVVKGRAKCARRPRPGEVPPNKLRNGPILGRSDCFFYKLKSCKVAADLSGRKGRRR